jgi:hypothetical protein
MTRHWPRVLRSAAVLIAVAAFLDPAVTTRRASEAVVSVVPADAYRDSALANEVAALLESDFTVVRGAWPASAATVVTGGAVPRGEVAPGPVFAVVPPPAPLSLGGVRWPARVSTEGVATVHVDVDAAMAGAVEVRLLRDGALLDRVDTAAAAPGRMTVPLSFVPAEPGAARLEVRARGGSGDDVAYPLLIDVTTRRWRVLFHDGRPSWMSTFVRRTVEQDPRFAVQARVVTSRAVATEFGTPRADIADVRTLQGLDVIVIGAPELLEPRQLAGLEDFMRRRGGTVILLADRAEDGAWMRLAGARRWRSTSGTAPVALLDLDGRETLLAAARWWPDPLPAGARPLLLDGDGNAVAWRGAAGAGRLIVSGALDSWQFRDVGTSAFETFWPELLAEAAEASPPPLVVEGPGTLGPGEWGVVQVTLRDAALRAADAPGVAPQVAAELTGHGDIRLWPTMLPGVMRGEFRAPMEPGAWTLRVVTGDIGAETTVAVAEHPHQGRHGERELLAALVSARGGAVLDASGAASLPRLLQQVLQSERSPRPWHPMRSPWWIVPFAAALGGEWWWRRRRALP